MDNGDNDGTIEDDIVDVDGDDDDLLALFRLLTLSSLALPYPLRLRPEVPESRGKFIILLPNCSSNSIEYVSAKRRLAAELENAKRRLKSVKEDMKRAQLAVNCHIVCLSCLLSSQQLVRACDFRCLAILECCVRWTRDASVMKQ